METRLCGVCGEKKIFIKKRSLCKNCYYTAYREGLIAYDENANCEVENMAMFRVARFTAGERASLSRKWCKQWLRNQPK